MNIEIFSSNPSERWLRHCFKLKMVEYKSSKLPAKESLIYLNLYVKQGQKVKIGLIWFYTKVQGPICTFFKTFIAKLFLTVQSRYRHLEGWIG